MSVEIDINELYDLYINQNKTRQEVADVFEVSSNQIKYLVKKLNMIKSRDLFSINIGKSLIGKEVSTETKEKISKSKQNSIPWNKDLTKEIDNRIASTKGRVLTDSQRKIISKRTKEAMKNPNIRQKIIKSNKSRVFTNEHRLKLSLSSKRLWSNPSYALKCSNPKFGNKPIYNDIKFQSDTEMLFAKKLNELHIKYIYYVGPFKYLYSKDNTFHNYYPDFYICNYDLYLEIKYNKNILYDKAKVTDKIKGMNNLNKKCILLDRKDISDLYNILEQTKHADIG